MKSFNKLFITSIMVLMTVAFCQTAFAAKTLSLGRNAVVNNTAADDDAARIATLDVTLAGGSDVNGLVFTLNYNPAVFTFEGLEKGAMDIDDGTIYAAAEVALEEEFKDDPDKDSKIASALAAIVRTTLYYQTNNKPAEGIVLIAAAAANYFTADFTAFKAKFKVKPGIGSGNYEIGIQKTIIGPDTAENAGYLTPTHLAVAAGLHPDNDPTTAQTFDVAFQNGLITVDGGYDVTGTVVYASDPQTNADGALVKLIKVLDTGEFVVGTQVVNDGSYTFAKAPKGTYRVKVISTTPGYQKLFVTNSFEVVDANITVDPIVLAAYAAKSGTVTVNQGVLSGLRIEIRDGNTVIGTASLDANGNYVTPPLPTGNSYTIWAVYGNQEQELTNTPILDWTLALRTVSGAIDTLCDGQVVELFIRSETTQLKKSVLVTGDGGSVTFTLSNLLPGTDYVLSMVGDGVGPVYYDGAQTFDAATEITVVEDQDAVGKDFAFDCTDLVTISGKVTVDVGDGVSDVVGVTVRANNYDFNNYKFGSAVTDSEGIFEIPVAKSDDYYVSFKYDGKDYYYKMGGSGVTDRTTATQVDVTGDSEAGINIPVVISVPDTAKLTGHVTLNRSLADGGIALENYLVGLYTTANVPLPYVTRTGSDGSYLFEKMAPGTYNVGLLPPPPYARQVVKGVVLANNTTATANFIVDQNYKITGFVMDAVEATPIDLARVDILKSDGGKLRSAAYTNASGEYLLVDIPSGVYTLIASHKDYFPKSQEETVLADHAAATIELTKGAIIEGIVSDTNGAVASAMVTIAGPGYVKSSKTNASGFYQFRGLAANTTHIIKAAKGNQYSPFVAEYVDTGDVGSTVTHPMILEIPGSDWTFSGTVKEGTSPVPNAYVLLFSTTPPRYQKVVQTNAAGVFTFTHVTTGTDYALLVLPGDGKPEFLEEGISIIEDVPAHAVVLSDVAEISGTITLSEADDAAIVIAGAYDEASDMVHQVKALNSGDNTIFSYTIKVATGVDYKVFAQDLTGTFPVKYHVLGGASSTYADGTVVTGTKDNVDIDLTK